MTTPQPPWHSTVSGALASVCYVYTGLPFDVVKVRLQASTQYKGIFDCVVRTIKKEGFFALYKGATPSLATSAIENCVVFTANRVIREMWIKAAAKRDIEDLKVWELACIGGLSGICSSTAICPTEQIKCRLQVQQGLAGVVKSPVEVAMTIIKEKGPSGLFKGVNALLARDVPFYFMFYGCYETLSCMLLARSEDRTRSDLNAFETMFAGGVAGAVPSFITYPFDTIKTRMQTSNLTFSNAVKAIRVEGIRSCYNGVTACVMRAFPANAVLFTIYELCLSTLDPTS